MPELPDITLYIEALEQRLTGQKLEQVRLASPFVLRSVDPPLSAVVGKQVRGCRRMGKRIVLELEHELFVVLHLMIAGRLSWKPPGAKVPGRVGLAAIDVASGSVILTESSRKKRASLHIVRGEQALAEHDPGGVEVLECDQATFEQALLRENHTAKRALTDPRILSGIGNAYSDEILHRARLSPLKWTSRLSAAELERLRQACVTTLVEWTERLRAETGDGFPQQVTAFRPEMAVHGRYGQPCPVCQTTVQRVKRAENELNYCPRCQTDGKLLADRGLSRLLKDDWPRTPEALEELKGRRG